MTDAESRLRGIVLMIVAVGVFAIMDALMKHLTASYPPMQIAFLRAVSSLPFVLLTYAATRRLSELRPRRISMHLVRAVLSIAMLWSFVWALARMSMANTYAITLSAPLLVVPFSALYMRVPVGSDYFWASLCILGAVFFVFRSSWPAVQG